ncbi:hypothetical protein F383_17901 [Gossypium arboreum]|uniref:Uncharacterized protein n=1 Tax=Gossypium arboreum TaxID=29729 RepID=A0A0B0NP80_GOSAR|nr:hypothetical protein F383_17901 [Gossypium arboreum]
MQRTTTLYVLGRLHSRFVSLLCQWLSSSRDKMAWHSPLRSDDLVDSWLESSSSKS